MRVTWGHVYSPTITYKLPYVAGYGVGVASAEWQNIRDPVGIDYKYGTTKGPGGVVVTRTPPTRDRPHLGAELGMVAEADYSRNTLRHGQRATMRLTVRNGGWVAINAIQNQRTDATRRSTHYFSGRSVIRQIDVVFDFVRPEQTVRSPYTRNRGARAHTLLRTLCVFARRRMSLAHPLACVRPLSGPHPVLCPPLPISHGGRLGNSPLCRTRTSSCGCTQTTR